ncbi:ParA family protein [Catalinimonas sp. 4WD22]|uniref:ParA family protein n=1 Tax=Catalinimonas locisalis TaxID=3133978 RepID=UPI0031016C7B
MDIFLISAQKGGAGKSTLTALISNSLAVDFKKKVLVIDGDEQGTISDFREADELEFEEFPYEVKKLPTKEVAEYLDNLEDQYDVVFVDLQGSTSDNDILEIMMLANRVLLPIIARKADLYSTLNYVETIRKIETYKREEEEDTDFLLFAMLNQKRGRIEEKAMRDYCKEVGVNIFESGLRDLVAYARWNTYESYMSSDNSDLSAVREEFSAFMNEFVKKYKL